MFISGRRGLFRANTYVNFREGFEVSLLLVVESAYFCHLCVQNVIYFSCLVCFTFLFQSARQNLSAERGSVETLMEECQLLLDNIVSVTEEFTNTTSVRQTRVVQSSFLSQTWRNNNNSSVCASGGGFGRAAASVAPPAEETRGQFGRWTEDDRRFGESLPCRGPRRPAPA